MCDYKRWYGIICISWLDMVIEQFPKYIFYNFNFIFKVHISTVHKYIYKTHFRPMQNIQLSIRNKGLHLLDIHIQCHFYYRSPWKIVHTSIGSLLYFHSDKFNGYDTSQCIIFVWQKCVINNIWSLIIILPVSGLCTLYYIIKQTRRRRNSAVKDTQESRGSTEVNSEQRLASFLCVDCKKVIIVQTPTQWETVVDLIQQDISVTKVSTRVL